MLLRGIVILVFSCSIYFSRDVHAFDMPQIPEITLRPYLGIGYGLSGTIDQTNNNIKYQSLLPQVFNSFGGHIGLRAKYAMVEFSVYGAIPTGGATGGAAGYGISSATMDMVTMRLTAIATLHHEKFGDQNNLLLMVGMLHAFSNISYGFSDASLVPMGLQYNVFGTHVEVGIGYMRDLTEHIAVRTEFKYSPISLSGVNNMMFTWNIILMGIL